MSRRKIDYGIDLGTTNSAIARMENGEVRILKTKDGQMDTTPSCVAYNKKQVLFVGQRAFNSLQEELKQSLIHFQTTHSRKERNAFAEFKRTMGTTETYFCGHTQRSYSSEELSAEVLKKVKTNVDDEEFGVAVITVPAMFRQSQVDATQRAAELAGFQYCELLQEPIAASIAYGLTGKGIDGFWLVFDFGGGTFDAALMRSEEGIIKVVDTSGDNHLGGKNLDYDIVDHILIPYLSATYNIEGILNNPEAKTQLRDALKPAAEDIKKEFSTKTELKFYSDDRIGEDDDGEEMEFDLAISLEQFEKAVTARIQRAISISLEVINRNKLKGTDLTTVLLVGGPTFLPTLRRMIKEQITPNINVSVDPMTAVAVGAAVFASTRDLPGTLVVRDRGKIQLTLKYPETTVEPEIILGIRVDRGQCSKNAPEKLFAEISRNDGLSASGRVALEGDAEIIKLELLNGKPNGFSICLFDAQGNAWPCEPRQFSIIQGFKPPEATLPFNLCVKALHTESQKECLIPIMGLEKNITLPAKGKLQARTQTNLQPGKPGEIRISIYGTENPYSRACPPELQGAFAVNSSDLPQFLPADSPIMLNVEVDASRRISVKAYFPSFDDELEPNPMFTDQASEKHDLERDIRQAGSALTALQQGPAPKGVLSELRRELDQVEEDLNQGGESGDTRLHVADRIASLWKRLDSLSDSSEWPTAEAELKGALDDVIEIQENLGSPETGDAVEKLEEIVDQVVQRKDLGMARQLTEQIFGLRFAILSRHTAFWVALLQRMDENFTSLTWKNPALARQILNEARQHIVAGPTRTRVEEYVRKLWDLQPDSGASMMDFDPSLLRV